MKFDDLIVNYLGEFGKYQKIQFFLVCFPTMFTAMYALSWTFIAIPVPYRCRLPGETINTSFKLSNLNNHKQCVYNNSDCQNFIFDHSENFYSAISRWNIVCKREIFKPIVQLMYYIGQMIGSLIFGFLGDRIGRKKVFFVAIILQIMAGITMSIAPYLELFALLRLVVGAAHPGIFIIAVVISMELAGPSKRKLASVLTGMFFSIGQFILGLLAYFIRDYRYLQAAIAIPSVIFLVYWWIVPESAQWLISQKKFHEADKVLQKVAKINKTQLPSKWWEDIEITNNKSVANRSTQKTYNILDLFRTRKLRTISMSIFFCWPVVSMVYYGLSMNPTFLGGNIFLNFIFGAVIEIPAMLLVYLLIDKVGRKVLLATSLILTSLCALSNLTVNVENSHWTIFLTQFLIAKCSITATYGTIYTFTPELFPTVIRNTAMGISSMIARVGAIVASFISMYLVEKYGKEIMIVPFSIFCILSAAVIILFLPETMGRELFETIKDLESENKVHELQPLRKNAQNFKEKLKSETRNN